MADTPVTPTEIMDLVPAAGALEAITRAEVDIQISTAKQYPRSITKAREHVLELATVDKETAESCFYSVPREGKSISGPSVRLAEIVAASYGNLRSGSRVVSIDADWVTAQGVCHDLESNIAVTVEVKRRLKGSTGRRYSIDMVGTTAAAAQSLALRNAVFRCVPQSIFASVFTKIKDAAMGDERTLTDRLKALVAWFGKMNVTPAQICALVGKPGIDDIGLQDLATLHEVANAIKEGSTSAEDVFGGLGVETPPGKSKIDQMKEAMAKRKAEAKKAKAPAPEPAPEVPDEVLILVPVADRKLMKTPNKAFTGVLRIEQSGGTRFVGQHQADEKHFVCTCDDWSVETPCEHIEQAKDLLKKAGEL